MKSNQDQALPRDAVMARKILKPARIAMLVESAFRKGTSVALVPFSYSVEVAMSFLLLQRNSTRFNMFGKKSL